MPKSRPPSRGPAGTGLGIRTKSKSPAARPVSAGDSGHVVRLVSAREERPTAVTPPSSKPRAADSPRGSVSSASEQLAEGWQLAGTKRRPMRCTAYYEMKEQQAQDAEAARSMAAEPSGSRTLLYPWDKGLGPFRPLRDPAGQP